MHQPHSLTRAPENKITTTFILGGTRSGKSRWASSYASELQNRHPEVKQAHLIVTADNDDEAFADRIQAHIKERSLSPANPWQVHEAPDDITAVLAKLNKKSGPLLCLIDGLGVWLTNAIYASRDKATDSLWQRLCVPLINGINQFQHRLIIVSTECSLGVHPVGAESRQFVDLLGHLHQAISQGADQSFFVIAGRALLLEEASTGASITLAAQNKSDVSGHDL